MAGDGWIQSEGSIHKHLQWICLANRDHFSGGSKVGPSPSTVNIILSNVETLLTHIAPPHLKYCTTVSTGCQTGIFKPRHRCQIVVLLSRRYGLLGDFLQGVLQSASVERGICGHAGFQEVFWIGELDAHGKHRRRALFLGLNAPGCKLCP